MSALIQELDRAIERGWANGGHLAAIRELALAEADKARVAELEASVMRSWLTESVR